MSSALSGESLPITRYSAPYCDRKSRSIARNTSESSSTLNITGFGIIALAYGYKEDDCRFPRPEQQTEVNYVSGLRAGTPYPGTPYLRYGELVISREINRFPRFL